MVLTVNGVGCWEERKIYKGTVKLRYEGYNDVGEWMEGIGKVVLVN